MSPISVIATLVFAELLRAFGARSDDKPLWQISLRTNLLLALVVLVSIGLQIWSHHDSLLGQFLKTTTLDLPTCARLLLIASLPLLTLELRKAWRLWRRPSGH